MSISLIYFTLETQLNWHSASVFSTSSLIIVTELANLGVSLTNIDMKEGFGSQSKSKSNSPLHGAGENNLLSSQIINSDQSEEALAGAAATMSLLSLHKETSPCISPS